MHAPPRVAESGSPAPQRNLVLCAAYLICLSCAEVNAFLAPDRMKQSASWCPSGLPTHTVELLASSTSVTESGTIGVQSSETAGSLSYATDAATVDMNTYNIPLDRVAAEWVANLVPKSTLLEEGVYLGAKSNKELFVDTLQFEIRRAGGMGLELLEIAGGREDGLGITIVSGLIPGGNADGSGILEGDSIVKLEVQNLVTEVNGDVSDTDSGSFLSEVEERTVVSTECRGYDATVDSILSLPPLATDDETVLVTVKRLRRKPKVTVKLQYPPSQNEPDAVLELFSGENLRRAMLTRGVKLNDALSRRFDSGGMGDCGAEGTCATCVVSVSRGMDLLNPMKVQEKQILAKKARWRLACKAIVGHGMKEGEMTVQVNPRQWN